MNVYINSNNLDFLKKCINDFTLNSDESLDLYIDVKLNSSIKEYLESLQHGLCEYITIYTPYVSNFVNINVGFLFKFRGDNWFENCEEFSKLEYYQGYSIEVDIDSFNDIDDETFIDMLLEFGSKCGLYKNRDMFLNITHEAHFDKYNTFVSFMDRELGVSCFWSHVGHIPNHPELFGIDKRCAKCNLECLGSGLLTEHGVYYCPYKMIKLCELDELGSIKHRKNLRNTFKEVRDNGCEVIK